MILEKYYINMDNKYLKSKGKEVINDTILAELYDKIFRYNMLFEVTSVKNNKI